MVINFQDGLTRLHEALADMATMPVHAPSGFISRKTVFEGIRAGLDGLESRFPELVNEMNGLAEAIINSPQELDPEVTDAGDTRQEEKAEEGGRVPAEKTFSKPLNKKRARPEDDNEEEDAGRHSPRPRVAPIEPQGAFGQGEASTSTRGKRSREEATDLDDEKDGRRPERRRKVAKGKGKEVLTTDNHSEETSNGPPQYLDPLDLLAKVAEDVRLGALESTPLQNLGSSTRDMAAVAKLMDFQSSGMESMGRR